MNLAGRKSADEITELALKILITNLEKFGNTPGDDHKKALRELLQGFTQMATGRKKGRYVYPLDTGMGKTQAIVAWCSALCSLGVKDLSVIVSASKVEALCQLKRDLITNGVEETQIALVHSYKHDEEKYKAGIQGYASEPRTQDNEDRPVILVTHNKIKGSKEILTYNQYQGKPRNLVIWDESLLVSEGRSLSLMELQSALGWIKPRLKEDSSSIAYLNRAIDLLTKEIVRQKDQGSDPKPLSLSAKSGEDLALMKAELGDSINVMDLKAFLDMSQEQLRAVSIGGGGLITYDITVPDGLSNICILDASYPIRELERLDPSIKMGGSFNRNIKRYDRVRIHQLKFNSGRITMTREFGRSGKEERRITSEICGLIKSLPPDQGVIIYTFKTKASKHKKGSIDFKAILQKDMRSSGIDPDEILKETTSGEESERSRFVFLTWGEETSLSQYSYCTKVIFAGVLHRSSMDLASHITGQKGDLFSDLPSGSIQKALVSEIAHSLYQAMSRGSCRQIEGNQALPMDVWLIHRQDDIQPLINEVMPGVKWVDWKGEYLSLLSKQSELSKKIVRFLTNSGESRISIQSLKKQMGLTAVPKKTFTRALELALEKGLNNWERLRKTLVYSDSETYLSDSY